jgi:hypothetical protein
VLALVFGRFVAECFVPECLVPGYSFLGVALTGSIRTLRLRVLEALGALDYLGSCRALRGLRLSCLVAYLQVSTGCFKDVSGRGSMRDVKGILLSKR